MIDMELLRSYENGPRIWDAAAIHPKVMELSDAGLIEPVTGNSAWKITQAGLDALEAYDELGPTTVQAEPSIPIDGIDAYDFHNAVAVLVERHEPFTVTAGDGRPLARVEPVPAANFMTQALSSGSLDELNGRLTALADDLREQGHQVTWDGQAMIVQVRAPGAEPVTLADLVPATRVELKGDCALWNDGDFGVVLGPYVTGSVRVRIHHSGIVVQARPENIARLAKHP